MKGLNNNIAEFSFKTSINASKWIEAKRRLSGIPVMLLLAIISNFCTTPDEVIMTSPDGSYRFELNMDMSKPYYRAFFNNSEIIGTSRLGFKLANSGTIPLNVEIGKVTRSHVDDGWNPVYGEKSYYPEKYNQAVIQFDSEDQDVPLLKLNIRAYNEGIAFRYEFDSSGFTTIEKEITEFTLPAEAELWVSLNAQGLISKRNISELKNDIVERPILVEMNDTLFVAIGEAALIDFARMKFVLDPAKHSTLVSCLSGEVVHEGSFTSPWRTIMAGRVPGEILENNYLLLNLNEPNKIPEPEWIEPGKVIREVSLTTQGGMACVDFAVKHNLQYIEFDAGWYGSEYDDASDATTITVDPQRSNGPLDLHQVIEYAESKGIGVILYVNRRALEKQLDEILPLVKSWGVKGLKFGFVNVGSQEWTRWLHDAVRMAAANELIVDVHDEYRPTGYSRTYPNLLTQEGIRGDEESPDNSMVLHTLFVRMLAGAGDHTSCYFADRVNDVMGSHASQLAKAVCLYSPLQFLYWYDRPEGSPRRTGGAGNNEKYISEVPELSFFDQLPTVWDDTRVVEGYPGKYAVVARKSGLTWFVGALNGTEEREYKIPLDFLDPGCKYEAAIYTDCEKVKTPTKVTIDTLIITSNDSISRKLGRNEGMAIIIKRSIRGS